MIRNYENVIIILIEPFLSFPLIPKDDTVDTAYQAQSRLTRQN